MQRSRAEHPVCSPCRDKALNVTCLLCGDVFRKKQGGEQRTRKTCEECRTIYVRRYGGTWSPLLHVREDGTTLSSGAHHLHRKRELVSA